MYTYQDYHMQKHYKSFLRCQTEKMTDWESYLYE